MLAYSVAAVLGRPLASRFWRSLSVGHPLATLALIALLVAPLPGASSTPARPEGIWLMVNKAAVQIFACNGLLCGRILWLQIPRDPEGRLNLDRNNPDPRLRQRRLCGLTMIWGLHATGPNSWGGGWLYNPDDGKTYNVSAELRSADEMVAWVYHGLPLFGETKTLVRIGRGTSGGWC